MHHKVLYRNGKMMSPWGHYLLVIAVSATVIYIVQPTSHSECFDPVVFCSLIKTADSIVLLKALNVIVLTDDISLISSDCR